MTILEVNARSVVNAKEGVVPRQPRWRVMHKLNNRISSSSIWKCWRNTKVKRLFQFLLITLQIH